MGAGHHPLNLELLPLLHKRRGWLSIHRVEAPGDAATVAKLIASHGSVAQVVATGSGPMPSRQRSR